MDTYQFQCSYCKQKYYSLTRSGRCNLCGDAIIDYQVERDRRSQSPGRNYSQGAYRTRSPSRYRPRSPLLEHRTHSSIGDYYHRSPPRYLDQPRGRDPYVPPSYHDERSFERQRYGDHYYPSHRLDEPRIGPYMTYMEEQNQSHGEYALELMRRNTSSSQNPANRGSFAGSDRQYQESTGRDNQLRVGSDAQSAVSVARSQHRQGIDSHTSWYAGPEDDLNSSHHGRDRPLGSVNDVNVKPSSKHTQKYTGKPRNRNASKGVSHNTPRDSQENTNLEVWCYRHHQPHVDIAKGKGCGDSVIDWDRFQHPYPWKAACGDQYEELTRSLPQQIETAPQFATLLQLIHDSIGPGFADFNKFRDRTLVGTRSPLKELVKSHQLDKTHAHMWIKFAASANNVTWQAVDTQIRKIHSAGQLFISTLFTREDNKELDESDNVFIGMSVKEDKVKSAKVKRKPLDIEALKSRMQEACQDLAELSSLGIGIPDLNPRAQAWVVDRNAVIADYVDQSRKDLTKQINAYVSGHRQIADNPTAIAVFRSCTELMVSAKPTPNKWGIRELVLPHDLITSSTTS